MNIFFFFFTKINIYIYFYFFYINIIKIIIIRLTLYIEYNWDGSVNGICLTTIPLTLDLLSIYC